MALTGVGRAVAMCTARVAGRCPAGQAGSMDEVSASTYTGDAAGPFGRSGVGRAVLYPNAYTWFILLAAMDITVTWVILHCGGQELNVVADWIIHRFDLPGVVIYKFALVTFVVLVCEVAGRRSRRTGLMLAYWAIALTAFPVVVGLVQLTAALAGPEGPPGLVGAA